MEPAQRAAVFLTVALLGAAAAVFLAAGFFAVALLGAAALGLAAGLAVLEAALGRALGVAALAIAAFFTGIGSALPSLRKDLSLCESYDNEVASYECPAMYLSPLLGLWPGGRQARRPP